MQLVWCMTPAGIVLPQPRHWNPYMSLARPAAPSWLLCGHPCLASGNAYIPPRHTTCYPTVPIVSSEASFHTHTHTHVHTYTHPSRALALT